MHVNARYVRLSFLEIWSAKLAYIVGDPSWDTPEPSSLAELGVSEVQIIGGSTTWCIRGMELYGANTVVQITNTNMYALPHRSRARMCTRACSHHKVTLLAGTRTPRRYRQRTRGIPGGRMHRRTERLSSQSGQACI